jgi:hypothetical protein
MTSQSPKYRELITTDGKPVTSAIMAFAHTRAKIEMEGHRRLNAQYGWEPIISYGKVFQRELKNAWQWSAAVRNAGQGEAAARSVPMFRNAHVAEPFRSIVNTFSAGV